LPLSLARGSLATVAKKDELPDNDLDDVRDDIGAVTAAGHAPVPWRWYEEGYDKEPVGGADPVDAGGLHASYITHHNGPQYFGYVANNPEMREKLRGLGDLFDDIAGDKLPKTGGVFYVKGGYRNIAGLKPADPNAQQVFLGDDDHPGYSDAMISEALVARAVNAIAKSRYWNESAIIITWDDSEGDYDHVPPPIRAKGPDGSVISDGPRVPLILISPYARAGYVAHAQGNQASVVKFADAVFNLPALALLPDEERGRKLGEKEFGQKGLGPEDAITPGVGNLMEAFSPARLLGKAPPLPASYVEIPDSLVQHLPQETGYGCADLGIVTTDRQLHITNKIPDDFN
ncbi:MAG: alkaline phosphatase family protein, partial [Limisphaerales bacterium]